MTYKRWTEEEKAYLRKAYGSRPTPLVAADLGRTEKQVREAAKRFCELRAHNKLADYEHRLRQLHAQGSSISAITKELALPGSTVELWLRRLGLSGNGWHAHSTRSRRHTVMAKRLADNAGLIWRALRSAYPAGDADPRVRRLGTMDDLFAEVYLALLCLSHNYDRRKGNLSSWVMRSAVLRSRRILLGAGLIRVPTHQTMYKHAEHAERARRAQTGGSDEVALYWREAVDHVTPPWLVLAQKDELTALSNALSVLPLAEQDVIRRYYFGEQDEQAIATDLSTSKPRVRYMRQRALARLRELLAPLQDVA